LTRVLAYFFAGFAQALAGGWGCHKKGFETDAFSCKKHIMQYEL